MENLPLSLLGQKKDELPHGEAADVGDVTVKKTDVLTVLDPKQPKERLASMVLINPKPELNLDLTKQELAEIQNRRHHKEEPESLADAVDKYKKLLKDEKSGKASYSKLTSSEANASGGKEFKSSQDEFYGTHGEDKQHHHSDDYKNGFTPYQQQEGESQFQHDYNNYNNNEYGYGDSSKNNNNLQSADGNSYNSSSHSEDSNEASSDGHKTPLLEKINHESNAKDEETKAALTEEDEGSKGSSKEDKPLKEESENKNKQSNNKGKEEKKKGKNFKGEESKFKPKFIPQTKSESPSAPITSGTSTSEDMKKITDKTSSDKPGVVSQTMEYHSGNGKEHVDEHPKHQVDYDKMFNGGKLQDKVKNSKNGFFDKKLYQGKNEDGQQEQTEDDTSQLIANTFDTTNTNNNINTKSNEHWNSGTLSPMASEGFFPEDLGLTPINDQYENNDAMSNAFNTGLSSSSSSDEMNNIGPQSMAITSSLSAPPVSSVSAMKADIATPSIQVAVPPKSDDKIMGLLGEIEQAAQQTAHMAQEELKKINDGGEHSPADVSSTLASKRMLDIKSKKIDALLNSLHSAKGKELEKQNPKLEMEANQLKGVISTLGNLFSSKSAIIDKENNNKEAKDVAEGKKRARSSYRREIKKKDQRWGKSLLEFHPTKVAKSKIEALSNKTKLFIRDPKTQKYQSFIKSFEARLEGMTTLAKRTGGGKGTSIKNKKKFASQKHEINHLFTIKASDNVTSFPFTLPFATSHAPSPIVPSPKHGPVHPFRDLSVAHLSPWLHDGSSPSDFQPLRHNTQDDVRMSDMQVQDILLQPEPIIGPARSNTNAKPSVQYNNKYQKNIQPRQQILKGINDIDDGVLEDIERYTNGQPPLTSFNDEHREFNVNEDQSYIGEASLPPEISMLDTLPQPSELSGVKHPDLVKQGVSLDDFPPVNDVSDLPASSSPTDMHAMVQTAPKNPILMVSQTGHVAPSHDEVIDKSLGKNASPVAAEKERKDADGKKFDHLNLNTLTRKTHTPSKIALPKPPALPEMTPMHHFNATPFGHLKPIRARPDFKRRPLIKDRKSKDATRLMKHVKKKSEVKNDASTKSPEAANVNKKSKAMKHNKMRKTKIKSKQNESLKHSNIINNGNNKNQTVVDFTKQNKQNSTITTATNASTVTVGTKKSSSSSSKKSGTDNNQSMTIFSKGRSIRFKTSAEDSKSLMNGIAAQKKGKIGDVRHNIAVPKVTDFPMVFKIADFSLNDLPMLAKGRSYVLTSEDKGL